MTNNDIDKNMVFASLNCLANYFMSKLMIMRGKCENKKGDLIKHIRSLGFGNIREGVTLRRLGCKYLRLR